MVLSTFLFTLISFIKNYCWRIANAKAVYGAYTTDTFKYPLLWLAQHSKEIKGAFIITRQSFWARHSWVLARGPMVLGTVRLIYSKICSCFFNVDFWNGTPEARAALLNLWVPALIWRRFTYDFRPASGIAGGSKRKWQIQVECVTCLKRVIYISPFLWDFATFQRELNSFLRPH